MSLIKMIRKLTRSLLLVTATLIFSCAMSLVVIAENEVNEYYFKRNQDNKIALTFDDGPHPIYTPRILDILDKYNIKATFFIIGVNAKNYKETLKEIVRRGHEIGNHTFSHSMIKNQSPSSVVYEIEECRRLIYEISGENPVIFRPPGGLMATLDPDDAELLESYNIVLWSIDTLDWSHRSPEEISDCVTNEIKSGDIVLMHDYIGFNSPTPEALELMIPKLLKMGYDFTTVSDLIS